MTLEPIHRPPQGLGSDVRVPAGHAGVPMAEGGHDRRQAGALAGQTGSDIVPEVVEVEVPEAQPGDEPLEGTADGGAVELGKDERLWRYIWYCSECGEELRVEGDRVSITVFSSRESHCHTIKVQIPPFEIH